MVNIQPESPRLEAELGPYSPPVALLPQSCRGGPLGTTEGQVSPVSGFISLDLSKGSFPMHYGIVELGEQSFKI